MDPYKVVTWGAPVGIGVSGSLHLHLSAIGKTDTADGPFCVCNEVIAAEIAHRLRLPVPPFCVVEDNTNQPFFASLDFNLTGLSLPPIFPQDFASNFPNAVADLLVFDTYICNSDRHTGNLSVDYSAGRYNVFDHSHAVLGASHYATPGLPWLALAANSLVMDGTIGGNRHCLLDFLTSSQALIPMIERIESLDDYFLEDVVAAVGDYGVDGPTQAGLLAFLQGRRSGLRALLNANRASFTQVMFWSL